MLSTGVMGYTMSHMFPEMGLLEGGWIMRMLYSSVDSSVEEYTAKCARSWVLVGRSMSSEVLPLKGASSSPAPRFTLYFCLP